MTSSLFDIINHLNTKTELDLDLRDYSPWIINKALSFNNQTIHFANTINKFYTLDKDIQYNFYKLGIPKGKRFSTWQKKDSCPEVIKFISRIYNVNATVAAQYASLMSEEQLQEINERNNKGGTNGAKS
jgi:hypothetical protein